MQKIMPNDKWPCLENTPRHFSKQQRIESILTYLDKYIFCCCPCLSVRTCMWSARMKTVWWQLCKSGTKTTPITCMCPIHRGSITPGPSRTWWAALAPRATSWWISMRSGNMIIKVISYGISWKRSLCNCSFLWLIRNGKRLQRYKQVMDQFSSCYIILR